MKKYFILMFMALVGINYTYAATLNEDEGEDVFVEIYKKKFNTEDFARSVAMFVVEATYYASTDEVVVDLHEIGTATVCIVDANGVVVDQRTVETDAPATVTLSTALCSGDFHLVVDAQKVYAEGFVTR